MIWLFNPDKNSFQPLKCAKTYDNCIVILKALLLFVSTISRGLFCQFLKTSFLANAFAVVRLAMVQEFHLQEMCGIYFGSSYELACIHYCLYIACI